MRQQAGKQTPASRVRSPPGCSLPRWLSPSCWLAMLRKTPTLRRPMPRVSAPQRTVEPPVRCANRTCHRFFLSFALSRVAERVVSRARLDGVREHRFRGAVTGDRTGVVLPRQEKTLSQPEPGILCAMSNSHECHPALRLRRLRRGGWRSVPGQTGTCRIAMFIDHLFHWQ